MVILVLLCMLKSGHHAEILEFTVQIPKLNTTKITQLKLIPTKKPRSFLG